MLRIRLTRVGKKNQPDYRIVIAEHSKPIQGKFISIVGNYNPKIKKVTLNKKEIEKWLGNGAKPSNTVAKILEKEGFKHKSIVIKKFNKKPKSKDGDVKTEPSKESKPAETAPVKEEVQVKNEKDNVEKPTA
jgi:small subunit ribosomal protein S16